MAVGLLSVDVPLFLLLETRESVNQTPPHRALKGCKNAPQLRPDYF
jgi:hypothetical protein